ncbi:MAG: radical SAM protein [Sandaracinaceae bacterium]|nr:radical SAM protein [Sandaracinaceae bacterium]
MRTVTLGLGHACCSGVLCAHGERGADLAARLRGGGGRVVLRGTPEGPARAALVAEARAAGFREVVLATAAADRLEDAAGADVVRATLFSHVPRVHDRLAGRADALAGALVRLRRLRVPVEIEAPILDARLSDPRRLVELATRARPIRGFHFYVPGHEVPAAVAPPRFDAIAPLLAEAIAGVAARFDPSQGVPLCAFGDALHERFDFSRKDRPVAGRAPVDACAGCVVRHACKGPTIAYRARHGGAGLTPFSRWPAALTGRAPAPRPRWDRAAREAARDVSFLVLRPTIHCNQDCSFCSANESSANAFEDPKRMLRAIVRAAQRGVRRVSFSGGEPTLSPHLAGFVGAARRLGVPEVELVTNAVLLDRPGRVEKLAAAGLTHAFVSLHAHDEALSAAMTSKRGEHARTLRGIERLRHAGVLVAVNHVITTRNLPYLTRFVETLRERFEPAVFLSFAFVTPQYKALEHPELVPKLSDAMPHLRRAMRRALALEQPFVVGARQGVPPCFLGPFAAWSDVFGTSAEAASEDAPQKEQGPACARCRYRRLCPGLWRPYADRVGFDELAPVEGEPWTDDELAAIRGHHRPAPWGVPMRFAQAPPLLRDPAAEEAREPEPPARVALPVLDAARSRPLRVLLLGTGPRARRLAERAAAVGGLALVGVASPHAPDANGFWGATPAFRDAREAIEAVEPEAVVIAAASAAHQALLDACAGLPVLLEKPAAARSDGWVTMAIQERFEPALAPLLAEAGPVRLTFRCAPAAPDAPRAWGFAPLFELAHHLVSLPVLARGALVRVADARFDGASRPEALAARLVLARGEAELRFDARAAETSLELEVGERSWARRGRAIVVDGARVEPRRGAEEEMLVAFRDAVLATAPPPVPLADGAAIEAAARSLVAALEAAGAPLSRPAAPRHATSGRSHDLFSSSHEPRRGPSR